MTDRRRGGRWLGRAGLALGSAATALLVAELAARIAGLAPARYRAPRALESSDKRWALDLYPDDPRDAFPLDLRDPATRATWRARIPEVDAHAARLPHAVPSRYTEELCRGAAIPEGRPRVVVVGDSFTEGQGVVEGAIFAARLSEALGVAVVACGRRGLDFPALSERFDAIVDALEPDVVLYAMVLNDPVRSEAFHARQRFVDDWIVDRRRAVTEGDGAPPGWPPRLVQLVADRLEARRVAAETTDWYREMVGAPNAVGWSATLDRIAAMHARMDGRFLVALWPLLVALDDYPFRATHETVRDALAARGVAFHDALGAFEGADERALWVHPADRHPNAEAHARFARSVEPSLAARIEGAR